jgi:hypothetical protein
MCLRFRPFSPGEKVASEPPGASETDEGFFAYLNFTV